MKRAAPMWRRYLRLLGADVPADVRDEIDFHLEQRTAELVGRGMDAASARREAERRFGNVERVRREMEVIDRAAGRTARTRDWWGGFALDLRQALRGLLKSPSFSGAVVLTLALGIGATTALFGVVDALFLRPPAGVRGADHLVRIGVARDEGPVQSGPMGGPGSYLDKRVMAAEVPGFAGVAAFTPPTKVDLGRGEETMQISVSAVSQDYFSLLGVRTDLGRFFLPEEDSIPGRDPVAVISHSFWQRQLGGTPNVLGSTLLLHGQPLTVVGVADRGFAGIDTEPVEVWIPGAMAGPVLLDAGAHEWRASPFFLGVHFVARLTPRADSKQVASDATAALRRAAATDAEMDQTPEVLLDRLVPAARPQHSVAARMAVWLLVMAGVVLVIACANVANLLLARATARRKEFAVRVSLGASRSRMLQHHLMESVILAIAGAGAGVLVAISGLVFIRRFPLPSSAGELHLRAIGFAIALALTTGLLFGLLSAARSFRTRPADSLRDAQAGAGPERARGRRVLLSAQVALSLLLLIGAGLFIRSAQAVSGIDAGLDYDRLLVASADFRGVERSVVEAFFDTAEERALQVPGVEGSTSTQFNPFSGMRMPVQLRLSGIEVVQGSDESMANVVGDEYFEVVGTRVVEGRGFTNDDRAGAPGVAVVNETLAAMIAARVGSVLGQCAEIRGFGDGCFRIVGVAENQRPALLEEKAYPAVFLPRDQAAGAVPFGSPALLIRTANPREVAPQARVALQTLRPDLPYVTVQPLADLSRAELLPHRLGTTLFALFGVLALVLAGIGLYGVLAYFVGQRTAEIGVRRALGASEGAVLRMVLRQAVLPVAAGIGIGLAAGVVVGRYLEAFLYQVSPGDPTVYAVASLFLVAVALIAGVIPARRATAIAPTTALRHP